jgi:SPP1 family predicted phage head-tail adaptor
MNAGRFDEPIEIWNYTTETNSYGEPVKSYAKYLDAWGKIEYKVGREGIDANQLQHKQACNITMRYDPLISVYNEIRHNGSTFKIIAIQDLGRRAYMILNCEQSN